MSKTQTIVKGSLATFHLYDTVNGVPYSFCLGFLQSEIRVSLGGNCAFS